MEDAIDNNEMYMVYQPICLCETGKPLGFEALVRWKSKKYGFVSPADFIPLAEQTG
jgi:sensor c-di-GMP phosphodiesterase-like protein